MVEGRKRAATSRAGESGASPSSPLGERLRKERDRLGLSLRELARRLEVSPSLVSQIETGKIQPSVRTLYAIVSELGVSLDELFAPPEADRPETASDPHRRAARSAAPPSTDRVQRAHDRRAIELESGVRWERLTAWNDPDVEFLYATYAVGGASRPAGTLVRHNGREFGTVIDGRIGVTVGFGEYVREPGDSLSFESVAPHPQRHDGSDVVHAIWVVLGRYHSNRSVDLDADAGGH